MRRRFIEYLVFTLVAASFLGAAFVAGYLTHDHVAFPGRQGDTPILAQARAILTAHYLGDLPESKALEYGMIRGMLNTLDDPYTVFVEPANHQFETEQLAGEFGGVGVILTWNEQKDLVLDVVPDGPAEEAGILEGDRLIRVDETEITPEMRPNEVAALIRGPAGSEVTLTVRRKDSGETLTATLTRVTFEIPSVSWRLVDEDPTVGLIAISRFSERTPAEVEEALTDLEGRGAAKFIVDLRNNGGGLLNAGVEVAGVFLDGGVVMYEQRRGEQERALKAGGNAVGAGIPLVVLVNGGTASASEVVAGALSQQGMIPLIGQQTFGKGSVQSIFDLDDGSSLHVTSARWYTPDHWPLDGYGLLPTIEVPPAGDGSDAELARALAYFETGQ